LFFSEEIRRFEEGSRVRSARFEEVKEAVRRCKVRRIKELRRKCLRT